MVKKNYNGMKLLTCPKCGQSVVGWDNINTLTGDMGNETFKHNCSTNIGDTIYEDEYY